MVRWSWKTGASIELTLELWASSLRGVKGRIRPLFGQERLAASTGLFLDGPLGPERRKTGWMRAEAAGDDRALYLSRAWTDDPARMAAVHVPEGTGFVIDAGWHGIRDQADDRHTDDPSRHRRQRAIWLGRG